MKFQSLPILFGIFIAAFSRISDSYRNEKFTHRLYSVTSFPGLEDLYLRLREQATSPQSDLTSDLKQRICSRIFYEKFDYRLSKINEEQVIKPELNVPELREHYREIFRDIFEVRKTSLLRFFQQGEYYELVNQSKPRIVLVNENEYIENVFTCLVRNNEMNQIQSYYVSDYDYNVNDVLGGEYVVGRFIFSCNPHSKLILYALAEEYAINAAVANLLNPNEIKSYYLGRKGRQSSSGEADRDPICRLDYARRLRLCNFIFMGDIINWNPGSEVIVEDGCEKKQVSFWDEHQPTLEYKEWVITCKSKMKDELLGINYVSRGYKNNEVFVFKKYYSDRLLKLIFGKFRVSVVSED